MKFSVDNYFKSHLEIFKKIDISSIENALDIVSKKFDNGFKIFTCGNGGSAHNASHFITDWNKFITLKNNKLFKGISLCDNIGIITAYANDVNYESIFKGQLSSLLEKNDLLICISGSGNSKNVIEAANFANKIGADVLSLLGFDGGALLNISKYKVHVPSFDMQICEDIHLMIGHMIMKKLSNIDINER